MNAFIELWRFVVCIFIFINKTCFENINFQAAKLAANASKVNYISQSWRNFYDCLLFSAVTINSCHEALNNQRRKTTKQSQALGLVGFDLKIVYIQKQTVTMRNLFKTKLFLSDSGNFAMLDCGWNKEIKITTRNSSFFRLNWIWRTFKAF